MPDYLRHDRPSTAGAFDVPEHNDVDLHLPTRKREAFVGMFLFLWCLLQMS